MSEPAGWEWLEAWRNGTIGDEDFASLQRLLREEPEARRMLRRFMAMDTGLRDQSEATLLVATSNATAGASLAPSAMVAPPLVRRREVVAWLTTAVSVLIALFAWSQWPKAIRPVGPTQNSQLAVKTDTLPALPGNTEMMPPVTESNIARQREQLLASAPDVVKLQLASEDGGTIASGPRGDIVWSGGRQVGYLHLHGLASNASKECQYQFWIVGSDASGNEITHAGTFHVDRNTGELILPIQAEHFVNQPKMFVINVESPDGGDTFTAPLLARADGLGP